MGATRDSLFTDKRRVLRSIGRIVGTLGGACGLIATGAVFIVPMYESVGITVTSSGERIEQHSRATLLQTQSLEPVTLLFFSLMVIFSLVALLGSLAAHRTVSRAYPMAVLVSGILLILGSLISGFSVGPFYMPGAAMVLIAGLLLVAG